MPKAPPSFDFYHNDWIGGTRHLPLADQAAYLHLLIYQWQNGFVPNSREFRQQMWGVCGDLEKVIWGRVKHKFEPIDDQGNLANLRMKEDRDRQLPAWQHRRNVNQNNALKRWNNQKRPLCDSQCEKHANREGGRGKSNKGMGGAGGKGVKPYSETFEKFWAVYSRVRRTKKADAWRAWRGEGCEADASLASSVIEAAAEFAKTAEGRSPYCPGPVPWLRARRWEDDRTSWQAGTDQTCHPDPSEWERKAAASAAAAAEYEAELAERRRESEL